MDNKRKDRLIKWLSLVAMIFQSCSLVLLMRYSKTQEGDTYLTSTAVTMAELVKILTCISVILYNEGWNQVTIHSFTGFGGYFDALQIFIPSFLYAIQNNLLYYGLTHLQVPHYQVLYQFKVMTTAIFSVIFLSTVITRFKWFSLLILTSGVILIQLDINSSQPTKDLDTSSIMKGSVATLLATVTSGLAGAYFEKILKGSPTNLWVRNIQLGTLGLIGCIGIAFFDYDIITEKGFFFGWDYITVLVVLNQAIGGLVVAIVVKYADSIMKGFAMSISIIINSIISIFFFKFEAHFTFLVGTILVLFSVYMYGLPNDPVVKENANNNNHNNTKENDHTTNNVNDSHIPIYEVKDLEREKTT